MLSKITIGGDSAKIFVVFTSYCELHAGMIKDEMTAEQINMQVNFSLIVLQSERNE